MLVIHGIGAYGALLAWEIAGRTAGVCGKIGG
jgi:hypothetical protein